jgi:hypothetical protein
MPEGKVFVPLDLRGFRKEREPIAIAIDDEEEPLCVRLDVFTDTVHAQVKLDEAAMELLFEKVVAMRIELAERIAYQKGAAHAARRKGGRKE